MTQEKSSKFEGFTPANTTPVPDILFDELLSILNGSELKVLLYIIRRTLGFKKTTDAISFSQFEDGIKTKDGKILDLGCGLSRETISSALQSLEERGCIKSEKRKGGVTTYSIRFRSEVPVGKTDQSENTTSKVVKKSDQSKNPTSQLVGKSESTGRKIRQKLVGKSDTQVTVQETELQETDNVRTNDHSPSSNFPEEKTPTHVFAPEEEMLLSWLRDDNVAIREKDGSILQTEIDRIKMLSSHLRTKEQAHDLYLFVNARVQGKDNPTVWLGNLIGNNLKAWQQTQQHPMPEQEPAPSPGAQIGMSKEEATDLLYNNILQMYPTLSYGMAEQDGRYYIGIAKSEHDWIDISNPEDWYYLPNAEDEIELALAYSSGLAAAVWLSN